MGLEQDEDEDEKHKAESGAEEVEDGVAHGAIGSAIGLEDVRQSRTIMLAPSGSGEVDHAAVGAACSRKAGLVSVPDVL